MKHVSAALAAGLTVLCASATLVRAEGDMDAPRAVKTEVIPPAPEAEATKPDQTFAKRLFGSEVIASKKSYVCFVRRYDAAHLLRHPEQSVRSMTVLLTAEVVPEDESLNYGFRMSVKLRKKRADYGSGGSCGHAKVSEDDEGREHLSCGVDCDGGSLSVELKEDNKSVLVKLDSIRISRDDGEESRDHLGDKDDKVFRLDRAPIEQCKSLAYDDEERAAMLRK